MPTPRAGSSTRWRLASGGRRLRATSARSTARPARSGVGHGHGAAGRILRCHRDGPGRPGRRAHLSRADHALSAGHPRRGAWRAARRRGGRLPAVRRRGGYDAARPDRSDGSRVPGRRLRSLGGRRQPDGGRRAALPGPDRFVEMPNGLGRRPDQRQTVGRTAVRRRAPWRVGDHRPLDTSCSANVLEVVDEVEAVLAAQVRLRDVDDERCVQLHESSEVLGHGPAVDGVDATGHREPHRDPDGLRAQPRAVALDDVAEPGWEMRSHEFSQSSCGFAVLRTRAMRDGGRDVASIGSPVASGSRAGR